MMRNQITKFWNSAAPFRLGAIALALVTLVFLWPGVERAWTAFACLMLTVPACPMGSFRASGRLAPMAWRGRFARS
jgi:hypothetical protein